MAGEFLSSSQEFPVNDPETWAAILGATDEIRTAHTLTHPDWPHRTSEHFEGPRDVFATWTLADLQIPEDPDGQYKITINPLDADGRQRFLDEGLVIEFNRSQPTLTASFLEQGKHWYLSDASQPLDLPYITAQTLASMTHSPKADLYYKRLIGRTDAEKALAQERIQKAVEMVGELLAASAWEHKEWPMTVRQGVVLKDLTDTRKRRWPKNFTEPLQALLTETRTGRTKIEPQTTMQRLAQGALRQLRMKPTVRVTKGWDSASTIELIAGGDVDYKFGVDSVFIGPTHQQIENVLNEDGPLEPEIGLLELLDSLKEKQAS